MPPRLRLPFAFLSPIPQYHVRFVPRHFSSTAPRKSLVLDGTNALISLHTATGLPWYAIIPLAAITLRVVVTTPFTLYARRNTERLLALAPLIRASVIAHLRASGTPDRLARFQIMHDINKRHGVPTHSQFVGLLQIPVWIYASAVVRGLTGRPMYEVFGIPEAPAPGIDVEGMSWCADLAAADPTMALSVAFSILLLANAAFQRWLNPPQSARARILVNALTVLAVAAVPISAGLPSAVVLYWTTSAAYSLVQNVVVWQVYGKPKYITGVKKDVKQKGLEVPAGREGVKTLKKRAGEA